MTEELALKKLPRNRRHVDGDVGRAASLAVLPDRAGDDFLAGAGFARKEHRDVALRKPPDGAENLLHGRRLADEIGNRGLRLLGLFFSFGSNFRPVPCILHRAADELNRLRDVEGLRQIFEGAALKGRDRAVEIRKGRHDDDGKIGRDFLHAREEIHAREARHPDVGNEHKGALGFGGFNGLKGRERILTALEGPAADAFTRERAVEYPADGAVVVDHPHRFAAGRCGKLYWSVFKHEGFLSFRPVRGSLPEAPWPNRASMVCVSEIIRALLLCQGGRSSRLPSEARGGASP